MSAKDFETILLERRGPVGVLTLNRPELLNAINQPMVDDLNAALDQVEADGEMRALVVQGAGRAFCAGFDLKEDSGMGGYGAAEWEPILRRDMDMVMRFWHLAKPTIAAVHAYCLAGGFNLACACDITVAAEGTRFGEPELKFGSSILALIVPWLTSPKIAKELLLTGSDRLDARDALAHGLINKVVPRGTQLDAAIELARTMAVVDPEVMRRTKQAINRTYEIMGLERALDMNLAVSVQIECLETEERRTFKEIARTDGLKAAIAWRDSRFDGGGDAGA